MTTNLLDVSFGKDLAGQASKFLGESESGTTNAAIARAMTRFDPDASWQKVTP